jgi:hypothetical protein
MKIFSNKKKRKFDVKIFIKARGIEWFVLLHFALPGYELNNGRYLDDGGFGFEFQSDPSSLSSTSTGLSEPCGIVLDNLFGSLEARDDD